MEKVNYAISGPYVWNPHMELSQQVVHLPNSGSNVLPRQKNHSPHVLRIIYIEHDKTLTFTGLLLRNLN